jgi:hypothetical protein
MGKEKNRSHGYCCSESSQSLCVYMKVMRLLHGVELVICRSVLSMWLDPKSIARKCATAECTIVEDGPRSPSQGVEHDPV